MSEEKIKELETTIEEKNEKLNNQSTELDYLTNEIIPKLKKENSELKKMRDELTEALESSTEKYFDQLDINATLSDKFTKSGAENALNKVKLDKIEKEIKTIKEDAVAKVNSMKEKLENYDPKQIEKLKIEVSDLENSLKEKTAQITEWRISSKVKRRNWWLSHKIIEIGDYKEQVEAENKGTINKLESKVSDLTTELKIKQSNYDKLKSDSERTIKNLENEVDKLRKAIDK